MKTAPGCAVEHDAKAVVEGGVALCANSCSLSTVLPGAVRGRVNPLLLPFLVSEKVSIQGQVRRYAVICTRNLRKAKLVEPWKGTAASGLGAENRGRGGSGRWPMVGPAGGRRIPPGHVMHSTSSGLMMPCYVLKSC